MSLNLGTMTREPLPGDIIAVEPEPQLSRESVTLETSGAERRVLVGTVVGKITASGKYTEQTVAAVDGSQVAAGVVIANVTVPAGADASAEIIRYHASLRDQGLIFEAGISAPNRAAAVAALAARFIFTA